MKIDGKVPQKIQRVAPKSFQDHPSSSFKTIAKYTCTKTPLKTMNVDGITIIRERENTNNMTQSRSRETSFKTMGKAGRKKVSFQDTEYKVSKANSFKTIIKSGTKTMEETNNRSTPFKTFDEWVKARTAKHNTALKDASSFVSGTGKISPL